MLCVGDFGVKRVGKEHAEHLMKALKRDYTVTEDWTGNKFIGLTLDWDYDQREVHLSIPECVHKALLRFIHECTRRQDSPCLHTHPNYGAKVQHAEKEGDSPLRRRKKKKLCSRQQELFCGTPVWQIQQC